MSEINWESIARTAYEAYAKSVNEAPTRAEIRATFDQLSREGRDAWIAAAQAACNVYISAAMT